MDILIILLGFLAGWIIIGLGNLGLNVLDKRLMKKSELKARKMLQLTTSVSEPEKDEEGFSVKYDAHYTRDLEIASGLKVETQCDDTSCKKCYWKPRMKTTDEPKLLGLVSLLRDRDTFIDSLPDGYSDDLYQMFYDDWLKEQEPLIKKIEKKRAEERAAKARADEEKYYATPYNLIQKYKDEGRTYKPGTGWSVPKAKSVAATAAKIQATSTDIDEWLKEAKRLKQQIQRLNGIPDNLDPNPVVDMKVEYEWDLKSGNYYRTLVSIHKNGGKSFKKELVTKREYNDWRFDGYSY